MGTRHQRGFRLSKGEWLTLRRARKRIRGADPRTDRRLRALELVGHDGLTQEAAAKLLEVRGRAVRGWIQRYRKGGLAAVTVGKAKGASPKLTPGQRRELRRLLRIGPERCGLDTGVWTAKLVASLIQRKFKVSYHPNHVGKLMKELGFTRQVPRSVLAKADPTKRRKWKRETLPWIRRRARRKGGVVLASDEATFQQRGSHHHTWAERGVGTEAVSEPCRRTQKVIGAIELNSRPKWHFKFVSTFKDTVVIKFLSQLLRRYGTRKVFLVWDNAAYHKSGLLQEWLHERRSRIEVHYLPPYSPDLNATEMVWRETKRQATHNRHFARPKELHGALFRRFNRYQGNPASLSGVVNPYIEPVRINA